jgi:hypothetical protein
MLFGALAHPHQGRCYGKKPLWADGVLLLTTAPEASDAMVCARARRRPDHSVGRPWLESALLAWRELAGLDQLHADAFKLRWHCLADLLCAACYVDLDHQLAAI